MKVGIVGLGLIGGSFAKAYKCAGDYKVYAYDRDNTMLGFAKLSGAIDGELTDENIGECDLIIISLYPKPSIEYLKKNAHLISKCATVVDCCGTKRDICPVGFDLSKQYGFKFFGGHPMAGTQHSGFKHSTATMFNRASMIIVPPRFDDMALIDNLTELLKPVRFGRFTVTSAEKHDEMIAFTSQMAHIVSNAYIKSPTANAHKGFSAGSYKDLTRVAYLNEQMWAELFMENRDNLVKELNFIIKSVENYRDALADGDETRLTELLAEGKRRKEEVDLK